MGLRTETEENDVHTFTVVFWKKKYKTYSRIPNKHTGLNKHTGGKICNNQTRNANVILYYDVIP